MPNTPLLDRRDEAAIREEILRLSQSYTPAWRFNQDDPDVGSVLALLFARMFAETVERYNGVLEHNFLHYLSALGGQLAPALPSRGFACLIPADEARSDTLVPRGEKLVAPVGDTPVFFETTQDILVTPMGLRDIYAVSPKKDLIAKLYDAGEPAPFRLFDFSEEPLQKRSFALAHAQLLWMRKGRLSLNFTTPTQDPGAKESLDALGDCRFAMVTEQGEIALPTPYRTVNGYEMQIDMRESWPLAPWMEKESRWLSITPKDPQKLKYLAFSDISLDLAGEAPADALFTNDQEQNVQQCFAFGPTFSAYTDFVVGCDEALCKPGAQVSMDFALSYERVRIESMAGQNDIDWKLVMRRSDVKPEEEYDITISRVMWEYWNGLGWARLFPDERYDALFDAHMGEEDRDVSVSFTVPEDMKPTLWGNRQGYFVRARILRVHNALRTRGWYVSPMVENMRLSYLYSDVPQHIARQGNMQEDLLTADGFFAGGLPLMPYPAWPHELPAMYFRFSRPLTGAPLRILFDLSAGMMDKLPSLRWEVLSAQNDKKQWLPLNGMDGTDSLQKTGLLTFVGTRDGAKETLFGETGWWLRLCCMDDGYDRLYADQLPKIEGIYPNAVAIEQRDSREVQFFTFDTVEAGMRVQLAQGNLLSCRVEIESLATLSRGEIQALSDSGQLTLIREADGTPKEAWVAWEGVSDLLLSGTEERHYQLDSIAGTLTFGHGRHGKMPHLGARMRVHTSVGGGKAGNLPAGAITGMTRQLGFIQQATNPLATYGGCDQETTEEAAGRIIAGIRHRGRAVCAADYEALTLASSRSILRSICYSHRDEHGQHMDGHVTVVFLQRDYMQGMAFGQQMGEQVYRYLAQRAPGDLVAQNRLHVVSPSFIRLNCRVEATVDSFDDIYAVQQEIKERLGGYLDPVDGNFDGKGWQIGVLPNTTQIYNAVKPVASIRRIKRISMTAYTQDARGLHEIDLSHVEHLYPYALPINGEHDLRIFVG